MFCWFAILLIDEKNEGVKMLFRNGNRIFAQFHCFWSCSTSKRFIRCLIKRIAIWTVVYTYSHTFGHWILLALSRYGSYFAEHCIHRWFHLEMKRDREREKEDEKVRKLNWKRPHCHYTWKIKLHRYKIWWKKVLKIERRRRKPIVYEWNKKNFVWYADWRGFARC